jgi:hypothetical protein
MYNKKKGYNMMNAVKESIELIDDLLAKKKTHKQFATEYSHKWRRWRDNDIMPMQLDEILSILHSDCDVYWSDEELDEGGMEREKYMFNDEDLVKAAIKAKENLIEFMKSIKL